MLCWAGLVQIRVFFDDPNRFNILLEAYEQAVSDIQAAVRLCPPALRPRSAPHPDNVFGNLLANVVRYTGGGGSLLQQDLLQSQRVGLLASPTPVLGLLQSPLAVVDALASILRRSGLAAGVHIIPTHGAAAELLGPERARGLGGNRLIEGLWSWRRPTNLLSERALPTACSGGSSMPDPSWVPAWGNLPQLLQESAAAAAAAAVAADDQAAQFASLGPAIQHVVQQVQRRNATPSAEGNQSAYDHVYCVLDGVNSNLQKKLHLGVGSEVIVLEDGLRGPNGLANLRQLYDQIAARAEARPGTRVLIVFALDFRE